MPPTPAAALPPVLDVLDHAVGLVAWCPPDRMAGMSIAWLLLLAANSGFPLARVGAGSSLHGLNPFFLAFTAFAVQLAVVSGIVLSLGVLRRSGSTRRGKSAPMVRLIYDCGTTWIHICSACCFSYLLIGVDVLPAVVIGERPIHLVRIAEWVYTVPLVWYVFARVYTAADDRQLCKVVAVNTMMLTTGYSGIFSLSCTRLYVPVFSVALLLFCHQAHFLWHLPSNGSEEVRSMARRVYLVGQSLMVVYPSVWILSDLRLISPVLEQAYIFTFLDVLCKLVLVWSCIVLRFIQAFPVLHTCFEGSQQFLDASHDVRFTLDGEYRICDVDGKEALLTHYLCASDLLARCFLDICHDEGERRKLMRAVQMVDRQSNDTISPKLTLNLTRGGGDVVVTECVISSTQNSGLRLIGITFHEIALEPESASKQRQVSQLTNTSINSPPCAEPEVRQLTPSVLEMDSASCVGPGACRQAARFWRSGGGEGHTFKALGRDLGGEGVLDRRASLSKEAKDADGKSHVSAMTGMTHRSEASILTTVSVREHVEWVHQTIGQLLETEKEPAFLADMMSDCYPIVGCSQGFLDLTQYSQESILGTSLFFLEEGIPDELISKSTRKNLTSFCQACRFSAGMGGRVLGDLQVTQPSKRAGGSVFVNCCLCSLVMLRNRPYILGVPTSMGEGTFARMSKSSLDEHKENSREKVRRIREALQGKIERDRRLPEVDEEGGHSFFADRLQDHCILIGRGRTALRREPYDLPNGCLVFAQQPVYPIGDGSLRFSVLVDDVTPKFDGLPLMGFTRREPLDSVECYPGQAQCLAQSVSIGRNGEAFARDQSTHVTIGFKQPPPEELMSWCLDSDKPPHLRRAPCRPEPGDTLECVWSADGRLSMHHNSTVVLSFDTGRRPERGGHYYGFVDVCLSVSQVTLLPFRQCPSGSPASTSAASEGSRRSQCQDLCPLELKIRSSVLDMLARQAITEAVADCPFCVTVADPGEDDCPLVAVSDEFLRITGYDRAQVLGRNCRFLNEGCPADLHDIMALRQASKSGQRVTLLLTNRRRTGELFVNLLDLAGVTVAKDLDTSEDIWYLIGVQADVTHLAEGELPKDHLAELELVAGAVRAGLEREMRQMALDSVQEGRTETSSNWTSMEHMDSSSHGGDMVKRGVYRRRIQVLEGLQWCGQESEAPPARLAAGAPPAGPPAETTEGSESSQARYRGLASKAADETDPREEDAPARGSAALGRSSGPSLWLLGSLVAASAAAAVASRVAGARR